MTIRLDHQMREQIPHRTAEFPVTYYHDELAALPNREGPFHWHPDFEIATATVDVLDYQVGQQHVLLQPGDGIFVNGNMLHRVRQLSGEQDDPVPIILFSGTAIAPEYSAIYQKYIQPLAQCAFLPFLVFRHEDAFHSEINALIRDTCRQLIRQEQCYEMAVQRNLSQIFEKIFCNFDRFPRPEEARGACFQSPITQRRSGKRAALRCSLSSLSGISASQNLPILDFCAATCYHTKIHPLVQH